MSLADIPMFDPDPGALREAMMESCRKHGFASYSAGLSLDRCPPFTDGVVQFATFLT